MRLLRQFSLFALAAVAGLGLAACDGGGTTVSLTSISVAPASSTLNVGGPTTQLTVTGYYITGLNEATLIVLRGQEGTKAQTWLVGDYIYSCSASAVLNNAVKSQEKA